MKNADMPAMPIHEIDNVCSVDGNEGPFLSTRISTGLTKREMFAMAAMQGLLADPSSQIESSAHAAVIAADLLLRALDGEDVRPKYEPNPDDFPVMPGGKQ